MTPSQIEGEGRLIKERFTHFVSKLPITRRGFFRIAGGTAAAVSYLTVDGMRDVLAFNLGIENRASSVLQTVFTYQNRKELNNTPLLVVGDSSLVRPGGQQTSIGDLIINHLEVNHLGERPIYILAQIGATIPDTLTMLQNSRLQEFIQSLGPFDSLVSVGPDNMKYVVKDQFDNIAKAENGDLFAGLDVESATMQEIRAIGPGLTAVLTAIRDISPHMAKRFTVLGSADYSVADKIVMANADGTITGTFPLKGNVKAQEVVKKASARMHEQTGNGTQDFANHNPDIPIQLIHLFDLGRDAFRDDEHFNEKGRLTAVERTLNKWQLLLESQHVLNLWTNRMRQINS